MKIPLTSFIDFALRSGSPKLTCAQKIKDQLGKTYDPIEDYYKRFRKAVRELHREGLPKNDLPNIIGELPANKVVNYGKMADGYKKFLGKKNATYFTPSRKIWKYDSLEIPVNPELGLEWNGTKYLIKLYLKADKPSKDRLMSILALMKHCVGTSSVVCSVLDVRNSKLYEFEDPMSKMMPLIEGEANALASILGKI